MDNSANIADRFVTVITPVFNQYNLLKDLEKKWPQVYASLPMVRQLLLIDDFSTDQTSILLTSAADGSVWIRSVVNSWEKGQAGAILCGIENVLIEGKSDRILICDLDQLQERAELNNFLLSFRTDDEIVRGVRIGRKQSLFRLLISKCAMLLTRVLIGKAVSDIGSSLIIAPTGVADRFLEKCRGKGKLFLPIVYFHIGAKVRDVEVSIPFKTESKYTAKSLAYLGLICICSRFKVLW